MRSWAIGRRRRALALGLVVPLLVTGMLVTRQDNAKAAVDVVRSSFQGRDGRTYTVTNHLVRTPTNTGAPAAAQAASTPGHGNGREYLLVWAGDKNVADTTGADIQHAPLQVNPVKLINEYAIDDPPAPDFLAVIDATKTLPDGTVNSEYAKGVNTETVG